MKLYRNYFPPVFQMLSTVCDKSARMFRFLSQHICTAYCWQALLQNTSSSCSCVESRLRLLWLLKANVANWNVARDKLTGFGPAPAQSTSRYLWSGTSRGHLSHPLFSFTSSNCCHFALCFIVSHFWGEMCSLAFSQGLKSNKWGQKIL